MSVLWFGFAVYSFVDGGFRPIIPIMAFMFGIYCIYRWLSVRSYSLPPPPPHRRRRPHDPPPQREYNPEFDFKLKQDHG